MTTISPPAIFRPPGMQDSDHEDDQEDVDDVKPDLGGGGLSPGLGSNTTSSYPGMLRFIHPQVYRHYHPYLHIHNLHPYFSNLYSQSKM